MDPSNGSGIFGEAMNKYLFFAVYIVAFNAAYESCAVAFFDRDPTRAAHTVIDVTWAIGFMLWMIWTDTREGEKQRA